RSAGLDFCYPELTRSASLSATDTFDLALARKLVAEAVPVVRNDLHLEGGERIIVVTGPNQGGKTTFARTFGQLHHLAAVGCPVPGTAATIFLGDQIFTHFQREEDLTKFSGKLEDDLRRMREIVQSATKDSVVVMNEIFASTTLHDARTLGKRVLDQLIALGPLCLLVTFVDELATLGDTVVSMVATIDPDDPVRRTFRVERRPADGLAYALAVAAKYGLTYECLRRRVTS
ncbi:MAG: DNA mismatch repair protein MutS, partial [Actinomycetota bacterium]|nr:DNA mismatch repair protein MutS [Actinomycetota bacterium]